MEWMRKAETVRLVVPMSAGCGACTSSTTASTCQLNATNWSPS